MLRIFMKGLMHEKEKKDLVLEKAKIFE